MTDDERFEEAMRHNQMVKDTHRWRGGKCSMRDEPFRLGSRNDIYEPAPKGKEVTRRCKAQPE